MTIYSKVYSVKSNAARAAKPHGLTRADLEACEGGWRFVMPNIADELPEPVVVEKVGMFSGKTRVTYGAEAERQRGCALDSLKKIRAKQKKSINEVTEATQTEASIEAPAEPKGFFANLTPDQKEQAGNYDGPELHGLEDAPTEPATETEYNDITVALLVSSLNPEVASDEVKSADAMMAAIKNYTSDRVFSGKRRLSEARTKKLKKDTEGADEDKPKGGPGRRRKENGIGKKVIGELRTNWTTVDDLVEMTGWEPHTTRAYISVQSRKLGLQAERKRVEGVTSYRIL